MTDSDVRRLEDKVDDALRVLAELKGFLAPTIAALKETQENQGKLSLDHEIRIRRLERFRFSMPSVAVLSLLVSIGVLIYYLTSLKG